MGLDDYKRDKLAAEIHKNDKEMMEKARLKREIEEAKAKEKAKGDDKYIGMGQAQAIKEALAEGLEPRVLRKGSIVTLEAVLNRINFHVDENNTVVKVTKG